MKNLREILFHEFASEGRDKLITEYKERFEPKKGDRFNINGITYEVGQIILEPDGIQFEVSSKIPLEELESSDQAQNYFERVKELVCQMTKQPVYAGMDDVVHTLGERQIKKRDYVRLKYKFSYAELYNEEELLKEAEALCRGESQKRVENIPGVVTEAGRMVLMSIQEKTYQYAKQAIDALIEANEKVRQSLKAA